MKKIFSIALFFLVTIAPLWGSKINIKINQFSSHNVEYHNENLVPNTCPPIYPKESFFVCLDASDDLEKISFSLNDNEESFSINLETLLNNTLYPCRTNHRLFFNMLGNKVGYLYEQTCSWTNFFYIDDTIYLSITFYDKDVPVLAL